MTFTNLFLPTDPLFLAILLVKQYIKLEWPNATCRVIIYLISGLPYNTSPFSIAAMSLGPGCWPALGMTLI